MNIVGNLKGTNIVKLEAGSIETYTESLDLTGELFEPVDNTVQEVELSPEVNPNIGDESDPTSYNFNYKTLSRLTTKQDFPLVVTVPKTKVNTTFGKDLSEYLSGFSLSFPISGAIEGEVHLTAIPNDLEIETGQQITIQQCFYPLGQSEKCIKVGTLYIVTIPKKYSDIDGTIDMDLTVGDELAYHAERARIPLEKYCGKKPVNVGEAAEIYANTRGLFTKQYPKGHSMPSLDDQSFSSESPYEYLQSLYAPTNRDVRCNPESKIIVEKRPEYGGKTIHKINWDQILELDPRTAYDYEEMSEVELNNTFTIVKPLEEDQTSYVTVTSVPSNEKPWFKGGYTETEVTTWKVGEQEIHRESVQMGYVPTVSQWSESDQKADQCDDGSFDDNTSNPIPVEWGLVKKEIFAISAENHKSGSKLVTKEEKWSEGKKVERGTGEFSDTYKLYDGKLSYKVTKYENTPQINPEVCEKDYIHLMTRRYKERYGFTESVFGYRLQEKEIERYVPITKSTLGLTSYVGTGQVWKKTISRGEYSEDDDSFIVQPDRTIEGEDPPNSKWIRPPKDDVNAFTTVEDDQVTKFTGKPESIEAPFCFNMLQLETLGHRHLAENNGLAKSIEIVLPYHYTINLGDSVRYKNRFNEYDYYLVHNISINQDGPDSVKTLLLRRVVL